MLWLRTEVTKAGVSVTQRLECGAHAAQTATQLPGCEAPVRTHISSLDRSTRRSSTSCAESLSCSLLPVVPSSAVEAVLLLEAC